MKEEKFNKNEIIYLDILKIFACLMVIINHTNILMLENNTFENTTFYCIMYSLCKVGVGIFLMTTGTLVLDKNYSYRKIIKCIIRVFVPAIILSFLFYIENTTMHDINIIQFLKSILYEPYIEPYWYIYALIGIYLVLPFIQKMVKNFSNKDYIIFILIFLIIPTLINFLKIYTKFNINSSIQAPFFPIIIATVICGNYISKIKTSKKKLIISTTIFIISYIIMFLSMYLPYLDHGEISYALDYWDAFPVILMTISLFYIVRHLLKKKKYSKKTSHIIKTITSTTFGIYLIHIKLNYKIYKLGVMQTLFDFNAIIGIITLDIMIFITCMILTYIFKKIIDIKNLNNKNHNI